MLPANRLKDSKDTRRAGLVWTKREQIAHARMRFGAESDLDATHAEQL
jgi:hypothetical protein